MLATARQVMGARVRLVPLAENHLGATFEWVNDPAMMRLLGRTASVEPDEHQRWFLGLSTRTDCRYFAVETTESGRHVGNVWLWDMNAPDRKSEVRVLFGDEVSRGHGYGSEAIALLANLAFTTFDVHRLYAYVFARNPREAGVRKSGVRGRRTSEAGAAVRERVHRRLSARQVSLRRESDVGFPSVQLAFSGLGNDRDFTHPQLLVPP
jgi:RimJ/RimL family protein N-acetyltransferase